MITIGIDPGAEAGIAVWAGDRLVLCQDIRRPKLDEVDPWRRIRALQAGALAAGLDVSPGGRVCGGAWALAVEAQYAGRVSALKVAGHAATWEQAARYVSGCVTITKRIPASTWQAMIGGARGKSKIRKARARAVFVERWPELEGRRQGAIDATWIGLCAHVARLDERPGWLAALTG